MELPQAPPEVLLEILVRYPYFTAKVLCRSRPEVEAICQDPYYWARRAEEHFGLPRSEFYEMVDQVEARGSPDDLAPVQVYLSLELIQAIRENDVPRAETLLKEGILEDPILLEHAVKEVTRDHYYNIYAMLVQAGAPTESEISGMIINGKLNLLLRIYNPWVLNPSSLPVSCMSFNKNHVIRILRLLSVPLPQECRLERDELLIELNKVPLEGQIILSIQYLRDQTTPSLQYLYCFSRLTKNEICKLILRRLIELGAMTS